MIADKATRLVGFAVLAVGALVSTGCPDETDTTPGGDGGPPPGPPAWQVVLDGEDLDRVTLSVWGAGPSDVFAVGGPLGNPGYETLAIHFDGG